MTGDEPIVIEIDPEILKQGSALIAQALINNEITIEAASPVIYEYEVHEIRLDVISSSVLGLTDPIGQIRDFFRGLLSWLWDKISSAIADVLAKTLAKLGDIAPQIAAKIAEAITIISGAISAAITSITGAISTGLFQISAGITALSTSMVNLGTAISGAITMIGTSLATQISNVALSISTSILSIATSLSGAIAMVGTSISQTILNIATSISASIAMVSTSISLAITQVATSIAGSIAMLGASLSTAIVQVTGAIAAGIANIGGAIAQSVNLISGAIAQGIVSISTAIAYASGTILTALAAGVALLQGRLDYAVAIMQDFFPQFVSSLKAGYIEISGAIRDMTAEMGRTITNVMRETVQTIANNIITMANAIVTSLNNVVDAIVSASSKITETLLENFTSFMTVLIDAYNRLSDALNQSLKNFIDTLSSSLDKLTDAIIESHKKTIDAIIDASDKTRDFITQTSKDLTDTILRNLDETMKALMDALEDWKRLMSEIESTFQGFVNSILQLPERLDPTMKKHAQYTWDEYWARFYRETSEDLRTVFKEIPKFFMAASISPFEVVINSLLGKHAPVSMMAVGITPSGYFFKVPDLERVANTPLFLVSLGGFVYGLINHLYGSFGVDLPNALNKLTAASSPGVLESIINAFRGGLEWLAAQITNLGKMIADAIRGAIAGFMGMVSEAFNSFIGAVTGVDFKGWYNKIGSPEYTKVLEAMPWPDWLKPAKSIIAAPIAMIMESFRQLGTQLFSYYLEDTFAALGLKTPQYLAKTRLNQQFSMSLFYVMHYAALPIFAGILARAISRIAVALGSVLYNADLPLHINLSPLGIGVETEINLGKVIGGAISHFGRMVKEHVDNFSNALVYGIGIWCTQPLAKMLNLWLRDSLPITLPTPDDLLELARRSLPYKIAPGAATKVLVTSHEDVMDVVNFSMAVQGYPSYIVDLLFAKEEDYNITVKDRFGTDRIIPLSLMYNLPSTSDVARMVVRDILVEPAEMEKLFMARGMNKDIAMLYYLLHFRYPPPERLWTFVTRGISGLLWYSPSQTELQEAEAEAKTIGAYSPVSAASLNYKGAELFGALLKYMKWHDYARFSYIKDFTSDNQIVIDTLADIPTKIDQRWMVRFGLYEYMAERGISITSPSKDFISKLVEPVSRGQISLDLANFCRTLQATGLHPYYVPITAVAETINAITDERTLLRTGILNLYKEGFISLDGVDALFKGVITTAFKVAYYDISNNQWMTGYINVPLRYLPMESKLMQLRAIMDRCLDVLRDIQRDMLTAYQEYIITDYDEFKKRFEPIIASINAIFVDEYKKVVGTEPPQNMQLSLMESYYKAYVSALSVWRDVHVYRRIRAWTMRWIGWLMYRIAYGVLRPEELDKLVDYIAKASKMTDLEKQYIKTVMQLMDGLAKREYIPTPAQLATMAEYVKLPDEVIRQVFEARGIPEEFQRIWLSYISVRPIADDIKAVISAYRRALVYTTVPEDLERAVKSAMRRINFTAEEEGYLDLRAKLEELVLASRELVPTPSQIATLAEVCPVPMELVAKAFEMRRISKEWRDIWVKYIQVRPIADDVRSLIAAYMRALEYSDEAKVYFPTVQAFASLVGFDANEMQILELRAKLEELIYKAREYVPTPITLASVCEILPEARYYFDDMVKRLRIPNEWSSLWAKYIDLKPLIDDIKKVLSRAEDLYCYFVITESNFQEILSSIAGYLGYTDKEKEFLMYVTKLRKYFTAWRELVADVDRMMSIAEYSPTAREFALGQLYKMVDALPIDDETKATIKRMWEEYIRIRPVKDEVSKYITDLINAYVDGTITQQLLESELEALKEWGLDDYEIQFYKAIAALRRARKLKIQFY